jgi:hypothetical protein
MRVVNVGTFLLPARFSLSALMTDGGPARVTAAVAAALPEFGAGATPEPSELLLDFHRSHGARQMESMVFEGSIAVAGLGRAYLYISSLSIGFVVTEFELPDDSSVDLEETGARRSFKGYELPLSEAVKPLVADWSARIAQAVDPSLCEHRPPAGLPAGELLWWHRIAVNPPQGQEFAAARWYGVRADLADGMTALMGNGFSLLYGDGTHVVKDVVEGLMVATQEWLIVDEAKRLLAEHLIRLSRSREAGLVSVDAQYLEVLKLTEEVTLRNLVLSEEVRYLANARMRVKEATAIAWRMSAESAELESRAAALRDLFSLHRERITNNRDDRRNRLIVVLTVVTVIQGILVWYDFLTTDDVTVAASPRPSIALTVFLVTAATLGGAFGYRYLNAIRQWWRRRMAARGVRIPVPRRAGVPERIGT